MKSICLDGREMTSRVRAHEYLAGQLALPAYYGRNLDALHDCLADICEPTHLVILHDREMQFFLGGYAKSLLQVFLHTAEENRFLSITMEGEDCTERDSGGGQA